MSKPHHHSRIHLVRRPSPKTPDSFDPEQETSEEYVQIPFDLDSLLDEEEAEHA